ncbi:MAG: FecCD family ABC transporter permease [Reyranellaceae bacterium]
MTTPSMADDLSLARRYAGVVARRMALLAMLGAAVLVALLFDVGTGAMSFPLADVVAGLIDRQAVSRAQGVVLWDVRLPQAAMAVLVGAALGLAGAEMQTMLNNPLASDTTLGVSAAATLGASIALVFHLVPGGWAPTLVVPVFAFAFAAASILVISLLARTYGASVDTVILFGIAMYFALHALVWLVQFLADADTLQQIVFWTMGSLGRATWEKDAIVGGVLLACLPFSLRRAWAMTAMRAGDDHARSVGIAVERLRLIVLLRASLLAATAVAFVGTIGFVGLIGPHVARMALGEDHRFFLPGAALAGALMLSLASIASKAIVPGLILPVGIVTALVGIPLFMALVLRRRRRP